MTENKSAFFAELTKTKYNITGNGTRYILVNWDNERFDEGNNFNLETGIFTASINGKYFFSYQIKMNINVLTTDGNIQIVTSNCIYKGDFGSPTSIKSSCNKMDHSLNVLCDMDAGDTMSVNILQNGSDSDENDIVGTTENSSTYICGALIC